MRAILSLTLFALLPTVLSAEPPKASPTKVKEAEPVYFDANQAFQDLLNALPEESLHVALNSLDKFKAGVFESNKHGVERVHHDNPPLATKLIVAAVQDLKKRQNPSPTNGTTPQSSSPPPQSSQPPPESSQAPPQSTENPPPASSSQGQPPVVIPVPVSTTDSHGHATVVSSEILSAPTASVAVAVTRTDAQGSTFVSTETKPAVIISTTDSAGSATVITSAVEFAPTPGQVLTTTDSKGSTFLTTYTPGGGSVKSVVLITTTGSDGRPSVITSYTFVGPAQATGSNGQPLPSGTSQGKPSLQSGAANKLKNWGIEAGLVGAGAFALWI